MLAWVGRAAMLVLKVGWTLVIVYMLFLVLGLAACQPTVTRTVMPSPDRAVSLMIVTYYDSSEVMLIGQNRKKPVTVGYFENSWRRTDIGWTDATTVNICPLQLSRALPPSSASVVGEDHVRRLYRIRTICPPPAPLEAGPSGVPKGFDYDLAGSAGKAP